MRELKRATREILYAETGPENEPTLTVAPGEEFEVETQMNPGPWLDEHPDGEAIGAKIPGGNPSSGCIFVEGANPGDVLTVHVGEFDLDEVGFTAFSGSTGAMPSWFGGSEIGECHRIVRIRHGLIEWDENLKLPVEPMLGFVGVAPARERRRNAWAGVWGGNFDVQDITTGAALSIPVQVPGALLHVGDMHARQGDGEICGAGGIETGGRVRLRCDLSPKPQEMTWPRITNETHIMTVAMARPAEDAFRTALVEMILWLEASYGFSRSDAYLFLGQILEARVTQFVNPTFSYVLKVPKRYLVGRLNVTSGN